MQSHLIQIALLYAVLKECRALTEANRTNRALMTEIQVRLEETFAISQEQKVSFFLVHNSAHVDRLTHSTIYASLSETCYSIPTAYCT